ncbi:myosin heavy chain IB-like isoform X3 [Phycodurus eques]|uniref:myosin heavy chain IB-like isoform X3 n=1 Tax=Phycodurus eques TaxID=693459 RepID=UPI002ACD9B45|nr:myosin heavy chain IB-like isoform X3 [Phycodurus eques]
MCARTTAASEKELSGAKEEDEPRRQLVDATRMQPRVVLHTADADHAVAGRLGPGQRVAVAIGGPGSRIQAEAAALPGGPAVAGPAGPEAADHGPPVQEQVWPAGRPSPGEDLRLGEDMRQPGPSQLFSARTAGAGRRPQPPSK